MTKEKKQHHYFPAWLSVAEVARRMKIRGSALSQKIHGLQGHRVTDGDKEKIVEIKKELAGELLQD